MCVLRPGSTEEVSALLKIASAAGVGVVPVSGNTGMSAGTQAEGQAMLSLSRMNQIEAVNPVTRTIVTEAGAILSNLHDAAEAAGLVFPLFFGARGSAMIGGALATNAGGSNVLRYGMARDLCLGIEAVRADGTVLDLMSPLHKDNSGLSLRNLIIGSEGTLAVITKAALKLAPAPKAYATAMVAVRNLNDANALLQRLTEVSGGAVEAFEWMPRNYIDLHKKVVTGAQEPFDHPYDINILVEIGATSPRDSAVQDDGSVFVITVLEEALAAGLESGAVLDAVVSKSETQRRALWERREAAAEIAVTLAPRVDNDVCLPVDRIDEFLTRAQAAAKELHPPAWAHWVSHLGDGNIHYSIVIEEDDAALKTSLAEVVEDLVTELGGSFSAEHGIGVSKLGSMARQKDPAVLETMRAVKAAFDPNGILNPGKVLPD